MRERLVGLWLICFLGVTLVSRLSQADEDSTQILSGGTRALQEGRASDAIAAFEALADRGVIDAAASYDRGLAYAARVRIGAEVPGDLGRAAQGFEEARDLTHDPKLASDATRALTVVRSEVVRRRTQAGESVEVDAGRSLGRTVAGLVTEDAWAWLAIVSSATLAISLFIRTKVASRRLRIGAGVAAGLASPALALGVAMVLTARHDRLSLREGVVVSSSARPSDERGRALAAAGPLPEGARVELVDSDGPSIRIRFGALDAWVSASSIRELAR